ncbi:hypothetical protein BC826DRAFT_970911 [Russula brevipes]|nr:hypothetical protein BC826DRAFT_970911 [Russula brevipes]
MVVTVVRAGGDAGGASTGTEPYRRPKPGGQCESLRAKRLTPRTQTSDVVSEFVEDTTFRAHLAPIFPPGESPRQPWDADGKCVDAATRSMSRRKEGGSQAYYDPKGQVEDGYGCMERGHMEEKD